MKYILILLTFITLTLGYEVQTQAKFIDSITVSTTQSFSGYDFQDNNVSWSGSGVSVTYNNRSLFGIKHINRPISFAGTFEIPMLVSIKVSKDYHCHDKIIFEKEYYPTLYVWETINASVDQTGIVNRPDKCPRHYIGTSYAFNATMNSWYSLWPVFGDDTVDFIGDNNESTLCSDVVMITGLPTREIFRDRHKTCVITFHNPDAFWSLENQDNTEWITYDITCECNKRRHHGHMCKR